MSWSSGQKYLAEFVGTLGLLVSVGGAAVFTLGALDPLVRVTLISLSVGLGLIALLYAFADVSGGHFNPAVTLGAWLAGRLPGRDAVPYVLAQVAGGITGMGIVAAIAYGNAAFFPLPQQAALASQCYATSAVACSGFGWASALLLEAVLTFFLVITILRVTDPDSTARNLAPVAIGLLLLMTNLVAIPIDGASINPARSFAPAILSIFWPSGRWAIGQVWVFWVGPLLGGALAALVERALGARAA
jgi:aquaporin Z